MTEPTASTRPKASASPGWTRPAGIGRLAVRVITRVDVGVVPHVERARRAGADRDARMAIEADHRIECAGREHAGRRGGEDDQRHHARLQQRDIVADATPAPSDRHAVVSIRWC